MLRIAALLGFADEQLIPENTIKIYGRYGFDLDTMPDLRFPHAAPSWA